MEQQLEAIRDQQKASWNKFSSGWKKWDNLMMDFLKPMGNYIIRLLKLRNTDLVLDIASGTGEPGLTIASIVTNGKVVLTDLSEDMLEVANTHAAKRGITNFDTRVCDVSELPFDDNTFDAISCRFGYMFFPDMQIATNEMFRVLKPGGRIATSVWNIPEKNFWVTAISETIGRHMQLQQPQPEAPGMFRCAQSGFVQKLFKQAGFINTLEAEVTGVMNVETADVYWNMMTDVSAPFVSALSKADDALKAKIKEEVFEALEKKFGEDPVKIDTSALVIYGEK